MGLYANEPVNEYWDPETGESYKDEQDLLIEADEKKRVATGKSLEALKKTAGWKLLSTHLAEEVERLRWVLVNAKDFEQVRRVQEAIKAYANVTAYVNLTIEESKISENQQTPEKG